MRAPLPRRPLLPRARLVSVACLCAAAGVAPPRAARAQAPGAPARARDLGVPFVGSPGPLDAITDVAGVEVGHVTLVEGEGPLVTGTGPIRTGVTAILPRGRTNAEPVMAAWFTLNGNGEMTGTAWVEESGFLAGPVMITNTHSVGIVRDAVIEWQRDHGWLHDWSLPVVAETWDGVLNDINGFHVTKAHAFAALESARGGPVAEGAVGGGTGMICHGFKGGIGTASRRLDAAQGGYTVGVLVQCNYGTRPQLRVAGVPVGEALRDVTPCYRGAVPAAARWPACGTPRAPDAAHDPAAHDPAAHDELGSIIIVVATDAPLLPHQLKRLVKRPALGVGKMGGVGGNGSGDIFLAFSTANTDVPRGVATVRMLSNNDITPLFEATVLATEEAIVNALVAARTMTGANGLEIPALPHDRLREVLRAHGAVSARR